MSDDSIQAVSVVIPTASVNVWLDRAIESILTQLSAEDRLVVFHDGVAPDRERPWTTHPAVIILQSASRVGVSEASRRAIAATATPLIARLDGDDISSPDRLSSQRKYLAANPDVVAVGSGADLIDEDGSVVGVFSTTSGERIRADLLRENIIIHSSVMFRRSAYDATTGYDVRFPMFEDYLLWLAMALDGEVTVLHDRLVQYRLHPQQATRRHTQTGPHMRAVIAAQAALARRLEISHIEASRRRLRWLAVQYAMSTRNRLLSGWIAIRSRSTAR